MCTLSFLSDKRFSRYYYRELVYIYTFYSFQIIFNEREFIGVLVYFDINIGIEKDIFTEYTGVIVYIFNFYSF